LRASRAQSFQLPLSGSQTDGLGEEHVRAVFQLPLSGSPASSCRSSLCTGMRSLSTPSLGITHVHVSEAGPARSASDLSTPSLGITCRSRPPSSHSGPQAFQLPLSGSQNKEKKTIKVIDGLSTPSLGITRGLCDELVVRWPPSFQLPLSGSQNDCSRRSQPWRLTSANLSTPSLGITMSGVLNRIYGALLSFNSLSRDHTATIAASDSLPPLSTPSLGITGQQLADLAPRPPPLSTPSLGITLITHYSAIFGGVEYAFNSLSRDHKRL